MLISARAWSAAWLSITLGITALLLVWLSLFQLNYGSVAIYGLELLPAALLLIAHLAAFLLLGGVAIAATIELFERNAIAGFVAATVGGGLACLPTFCGNNVQLQRFRWLLIGGAALSVGVAGWLMWQLARKIGQGWRPRWTGPGTAAVVLVGLLLVVFGFKRLPLYPSTMLVLLFALLAAASLAFSRVMQPGDGGGGRLPRGLQLARYVALLTVGVSVLLGPLGVTRGVRFSKATQALAFNIMGSKVLAQPRAALLHDVYKVAGVLGAGPPASKVVDAKRVVGEPPKHRYDVILFAVDALRRDRMALYGGDIAMPHTESLARRGMVHTRAWSPADGTGLSMTAILSGLHPAAISSLQAVPLFLPDLLRHLGYETTAGGDELSLQFFVHRVLRGRVAADIGIQRSSYEPPDKDQVRDAIKRLTAGGSPKFEYIHLLGTHGPFRGPDGKSDYAKAVQEADKLVGQLVADIDKRRAWHRTILILFSDHGEGIGDHGIYGHSQALYEEQVGVPLITVLPGAATGTTHRGADLTAMPTWVMAALGGRWPLPTTATPEGKMDATVQEHQILGTTVWRSVREGSWVYHHRYAAGVESLYDLGTDPGELRDVAAQKVDVVTHMIELEEAYLKRVDEVVAAFGKLPLRELPALMSQTP